MKTNDKKPYKVVDLSWVDEDNSLLSEKLGEFETREEAVEYAEESTSSELMVRVVLDGEVLDEW